MSFLLRIGANMKKWVANILLVQLIVAVVGCASTKRAEEAASFAKIQQPKAGDTVLVVPIGQVVPEFSASDATAKLSGPFALVGALVGAAIDVAISKSSSARTEQSQVTAAAVETKIEEYLANKFSDNLRTCGITTKKHNEILSQGRVQWDQKNEPVVQTNDKNLKGTKYFVETGVRSMTVTGGFKDPIVCIAASGLVFNTESSLLVNKLRTQTHDDAYSCTQMEGAEIGTQAKLDELKAATKTTLDAVASQLSDAICKNAAGG